MCSKFNMDMKFYAHIYTQRHIQAYKHHAQERFRLDWMAEIKVFSVVIYYLIFSIVTIAMLTTELLNFYHFFEETSTYFACESSGISSDMQREDATGNSTLVSCDRNAVEQLADPIFTTIAYVLLGFYPFVGLVYTVSFKEWREKLKSTQREVEVSHSSNWQSNNNNGNKIQ